MTPSGGAVGEHQATVGKVRLTPTHTGVARGRSVVLWPLGVYLLLSLVLFGLPVIPHLGSRIVAGDEIDSGAFMWFFAWWPHALLHGLNPFVTHAMFFPDGFNLTWAAAMPGPSIVLSPITLAFGPAVTWNVIQLGSPALSAWTMFLLCRHLTGRVWPSLAGGFVFGFSPYMLSHLSGAPNLTFVAILPILVLLVLRRVEGSISRRRFTILMTLALTAQFLSFSEVLVTALLFGGVALGLAFVLLVEHRPVLRETGGLLIGACAGAAILVSPFLYYFFFGRHYPPGGASFSADLVSFVAPPAQVALHRAALSGANAEGYLGVPLIVLIAICGWHARRDRGTRLVLLSLLIAAIFSLGAHVHVAGASTSVPAPWLGFAHLPGLRYALPSRFAVFVVLPAALLVAIWLSRASVQGRGSIARWTLMVLIAGFIAPAVGDSAWDTHIADPAFFSSGSYRSYLRPSDSVLTVPVRGSNERWQAATGFRFRLAAGYAGTDPASYSRFAAWRMLLHGTLHVDYAAQLRRFLVAKRVTVIVVEQGFPGPWAKLFGSLGVRPVATGGVLVYRVARAVGR